MALPIPSAILALKGPILIFGAGGFIGSNLFKKLIAARPDVYGVCRSNPRDLRLTTHFFAANLDTGAPAVMDNVGPATIFDCVAYGGYLLQNDVAKTYATNLLLKQQLLALAREYPDCTYIHGGSSSEYGTTLDAPLEDTPLRPNTHYAVSKGAAAGLIHLYGKQYELRCANLRIYAVYGPGEPEENRLIPQLVKAGLRGEYPPLVHPAITRDFIHVDDVCDAYIKAALNLRPAQYGESFNIGTGAATSIRALARMAQKIFDIKGAPQFTMQDRAYDFRGTWCARPWKAEADLGWRAQVCLFDGLTRLKEEA